MWSRKQKRCFQRIMAGFRRHGKKRLRFLTLTTDVGFGGNINKCFSRLRMRISNRLTVLFLLSNGWISYEDVLYYYGEGFYWDDPFPFEFIKVETAEGQAGVLHVIYFGRYMPQKWVSDAWSDITNGSYVVDIRMCKRRVYNAFKLACYCVAQYVSGGQSDYVRFTCSQDWCFKGFVVLWNSLKKLFYVSDCITIFNYFVDCYKDGVVPDKEWILSHSKRT